MVFERMKGYHVIKVRTTFVQGEYHHDYSGKLNHNANFDEPVLKRIGKRDLGYFREVEKSLEKIMTELNASKLEVKIRIPL